MNSPVRMSIIMRMKRISELISLLNFFNLLLKKPNLQSKEIEKIKKQEKRSKEDQIPNIQLRIIKIKKMGEKLRSINLKLLMINHRN